MRLRQYDVNPRKHETPQDRPKAFSLARPRPFDVRDWEKQHREAEQATLKYGPNVNDVPW